MSKADVEILKAGSVVLVRFPFTSLESSKKRPALVLKEVGFTQNIKIFIIAMITSQIESPNIDGDFELKDWSAAGLLHPSRVRLAKIASVENLLVEKKLGHISSQDKAGLLKHFGKLFKGLIAN